MGTAIDLAGSPGAEGPPARWSVLEAVDTQEFGKGARRTTIFSTMLQELIAVVESPSLNSLMRARRLPECVRVLKTPYRCST